MTSSNSTRQSTRIIACGVFKPAMEHLQLRKRYPHLAITFLRPNLHVRPQELKDHLIEEVASARERHERAVCLYGKCFPDIDEFCERQGIAKVPGLHCYEMFLGKERFQQLVDETAGTYFVEKELILNFEENCSEPLELYDEQMRKSLFEHYQRLLYVRQPSDPDLSAEADRLAKFLQLSLETIDADYAYLEKRLMDLI